MTVKTRHLGASKWTSLQGIGPHLLVLPKHYKRVPGTPADVVYNSALDTWFAGALVSGCGGFGSGLWSAANNDSTTGA